MYATNSIRNDWINSRVKEANTILISRTSADYRLLSTPNTPEPLPCKLVLTLLRSSFIGLANPPPPDTDTTLGAFFRGLLRCGCVGRCWF